MNNSDEELNYEFLENYFKSNKSNTKFDSETEFFSLIDKYENKYFDFNNKSIDNQISKKIFERIYREIRVCATVFIENDLNYSRALKYYKAIRGMVMYLDSKKQIKLIDVVEYSYNLCFLMYYCDQTFNAINECDLITSEYFYNLKNIRQRIMKDEGSKEEGKYAFVKYLEYLILISKLSQLICLKSGIAYQQGEFYYREKFFSEKLYFRDEDPPYVYQMVHTRFYVSIGNSFEYVVSDEKSSKKGYQKLKITCKRFIKGLLYAIFRIISGYGEKPERLLYSSIFTIIIFGVLYSIFETGTFLNFLEFSDLSLYIFTSFGLNDSKLLLSESSKIALALEIIIGIIFINGFIVTLTRKLMR